MTPSIRYFVCTTVACVVLPLILENNGNGQEKQQNTDQIAEQARAVREQTVRRASELESMRQSFASPRNIVQKSIQKSSTQDFELALKQLKMRQSNRLQQLTSEVDDLLNKIRELGKTSELLPGNDNVAPNNSGSVPSETSPGAGEPTVSDKVDDRGQQQSGQKQDRTSQLILNKRPVDELALANNLVAVGSYETAIKLLRKILKSKKKKLTAKQKNWVTYQLGVCYRASGLYDEALRQFRIAANSKVADISTSMAKWWIGQIKNQQEITTARLNIQKQIEFAGK